MSIVTTSFYQTGGNLPQNAPSYVERQADTDLYEGLSRGEFCYVLTSRQMGKSSLMVRTAARLREDGVAVVVLDLTAIGQNLTVEQWYDGLLVHLGRQLDLEEELEEYWLAHERQSPLQRWLGALQEVVLAQVPGRITVFIDEIDAIRSLPFSTDEFFAAIRQCYNRRTQDPEFARLSFCLLGVATPSDLIQDTRTTPFNIGRRIELTDFTEAEAAPLARGLGRDETTGGMLLQRILHWTGGHPYLTQRLCQAVAADASVFDAARVDGLCQALFFSPRAQERDDNILFVRERLLNSEADRASLLDLYARVRGAKRVPDDETNELISLLRLSGITRIEGGCLQVRNRIYEQVFDRAWIVQHMPDAEMRRQRAAFQRGLLRASAVAALVIAVIAGLAFTAVRQATVLRQERRVLRQERYAAQMNLGLQAWEEGHLERARELLYRLQPRPGEEDLRGFEWRYLWRLCQGDELFTLHGHTQQVFSVAFVADGRTLVSSSGDGTVKLWDLTTRRPVTTLRVHEKPVFALRMALSADDKVLATVSWEGTLQIWDLASRQRVASLRGPNFHDVVISPNGRTLAIAGWDSRIWLWDVATRRPVVGLRGHRGPTTMVVFSSDGRRLASSSGDYTVKLWNVPTRQEIATLQGHTDMVRSVAFSEDGQTLASGSLDRTIKLWDLKSRRAVATLTGHKGYVEALSFAPGDRKLVSAGDDGVVKLWDVPSRREIATLLGHTDSIQEATFSPDGTRLATTSFDGTVKLWSADRKQGVEAIPGVPNADAAHPLFSPDGTTLAFGGGQDGTIKLWEAATKRLVAVLQGPNETVKSVAFAPDGKTLAAGFDRGTVRLWDLSSRRAVATLKGHTAWIRSVVFSPDGKTLASGSADESIRLWDVATRRPIALFSDHTWQLAYAPDGKTLASGGGDGVRLYDLSSRREIAVLRGHTRSVRGIAISPDGKTLATCSDDRMVKLWDIARRQEITTLRGHRNWVWKVAFSPDGKSLASASRDGTVKLWSVAGQQQVATLKGPAGEVQSVAFSPDGNLLASQTSDGTVQLWRAASFSQIQAQAAARERQGSR